MQKIIRVLFVAVAIIAAAGVYAQTTDIDTLTQKAEQGDAEAQFRLGVIYERGLFYWDK